MIAVTSPYTYFDIPRVENNGVRYYHIECDQELLPSVTTILSHSADKGFLDEWRKNIGDAEATRITEESAILGTHLHKNLENYTLGINEEVGSPFAKLMSKTIIRKGLCNVSEIWGSEVQLYFRHLYAGTTDLIGVHKNTPAIIDFKNSRKRKKEEWIPDYFCQLVAYANAHNKMFNTDIRKGVIMMMTRDGEYQEFILEGDKFTHYEDIWFQKVCEFHSTI